MFKNLVKSLIVLIALSSLLYFIDRDIFFFLSKEDGILEYTSALTMLILSILIITKLFKVHKVKTRLWVIVNIILALGLFFGFGEEISWGQRIFSIETGKFFAENNLQEETNLHNLQIGGVKINRFVFSYLISIVFGIYIYLSLVLFKKVRFIRNFCGNAGIPIPSIQDTILFTLASIVIFLVPHGKKWEVWECVFTLAIFLMFTYPYNKSESILNYS